MKHKTHWKKFDTRIRSLIIVIEGFKKTIDNLKQQNKEYEWYDGFFLLEDTESIYGLAFR